MNQQHVTKPPPRVEQAKPVEQSKPAERRGPKVNPFGEAKPVDKTNEVMRQTEEKLLAKQLAEQQLSEKKSEKESKKKSVQVRFFIIFTIFTLFRKLWYLRTVQINQNNCCFSIRINLMFNFSDAKLLLF